MKLAVLIAIIAITAFVASVAVADDPNAPSWRGTAGSTFQEWAFSTNSNPATPESVSNPCGMPSAAIDYEPPFGAGWKDSLPGVYGSAQGWWDIARGSIVLSIINHPNVDLDVSKDIQVQVVYWDDINDAPSVLITPSATFVGKTTTLVETGPVGGAWRMDLWTFHVDPNQNSETITVEGHPTMGSQIDKIVVDTRYAAAIDSASQARTLPEGTVCELSGPVVTRAFDTFFYMENLDRSSGIRVNCASDQTPGAEETAPTVTGVLSVIDGERVIDEASVVHGGSGTVPPLSMICRALRTGLSPQGLFLKLWGRANVESPTAFVLVDGSPVGVLVELHGVTAPPDQAYVVVSGVLGANADGPVLRVGLSDTITVPE